MNRLSKAILLLSFKRQFWVSFYIRLSWWKIYLCSHYDFSWCAPYRLVLCLFSSFILSFFADLLLRLNFVCQRIDACATKTVFRLIAIEFVYDTHTLHPIQYQFFINGLWLKIYLKLLLTSIRLIFFLSRVLFLCSMRGCQNECNKTFSPQYVVCATTEYRATLTITDEFILSAQCVIFSLLCHHYSIILLVFIFLVVIFSRFPCIRTTLARRQPIPEWESCSDKHIQPNRRTKAEVNHT